jgi:hypothetical protein
LPGNATACYFFCAVRIAILTPDFHASFKALLIVAIYSWLAFRGGGLARALENKTDENN